MSLECWTGDKKGEIESEIHAHISMYTLIDGAALFLRAFLTGVL
jgi:hypothetical protein